MKKSLRTAGALLYYTIEEKGVTICGYEGNKSDLTVPGEVEGTAVTAIGDKAFFNSRGLSRVHLPASVEELGDWAFAHCPELEEIDLWQKKYRFGKAVFMECPRLKRICPEAEEDRGGDGDGKGFGSLLAAVCGILDAPFLLQAQDIDNKEWFARWDSRMLSILHSDDMEGYTRLLLCGEEDYGSKENDLDFFLGEKRKRKVRLAFLRLLYDKWLAKDNKEELEEYLRSHGKGSESEEAWIVVREEHDEDREYIELFLSLGCLPAEAFDEALTDLGDRHPQLTAYLIRYKREQQKTEDFFDLLSLD